MKSLKRNKSDGIDGFPPGMLKNCHKEISQPLLHIINVSLNSGIVPSSWKIAKVVPIHKKGTTKDLVIIAQLSVLQVLSKMLEKAVHCQPMDYLEGENLLTDRQFGYRQKRSTIVLLYNKQKVNKQHLLLYLSRPSDRKHFNACQWLWVCLQTSGSKIDTLLLKQRWCYENIHFDHHPDNHRVPTGVHLKNRKKYSKKQSKNFIKNRIFQKKTDKFE